MTRKRNRLCGALALALAAISLAGCGCGPFGLRFCHDHGYYGRPGYYR